MCVSRPIWRAEPNQVFEKSGYHLCHKDVMKIEVKGNVGLSITSIMSSRSCYILHQHQKIERVSCAKCRALDSGRSDSVSNPNPNLSPLLHYNEAAARVSPSPQTFPWRLACQKPKSVAVKDLLRISTGLSCIQSTYLHRAKLAV